MKIEHLPKSTKSVGRFIVLLLGLACIGAAAQSVPESVPAASDASPALQLSLPKALELASLHNRSLQLALLATKEAEENRVVARSEYFPHIRNESSALYVTALEGVAVPAGAFGHPPGGVLIPAQKIQVGQGQQATFTSGTGLVQPITQLLTVHAGVRMATADIAMAKLNASDGENGVALQVHKLYYDVLTTQIQHDAAEASVRAALLDEEESARSVESGKSLEIVQLQRHVALLTAKQASLTLSLALSDLTTQFDNVLGLPLSTRLILDPDSLGDEPNLLSREGALQLLKEHNPKILSAQQALEKARAGVAAAKDAYIPTISGLARYSYQSGVPFLVHNFGTFGGSVTYELFDGGAREAKLTAAKIRLHAAEIDVVQTEADIAVQVDTLYNKVHQLQDLVAVASEILSVKLEASRISEVRIKQNAGLASETERSRAESASAQAALFDDRLNLRLVENQIKQLLGQRPN